MSHMYKAIDTTNHIEFENVQLPEVTRQVRKLIKLRHGNLIRTALLEEGVYHARGYGRKKSNEHIYYSFDITIERHNCPDRCARGHIVQACQSAAGWYIGTVDNDGFPYCRISVGYYKTCKDAEDAIKNDTYIHRTCMEDQFCNGGRGCFNKVV